MKKKLSRTYKKQQDTNKQNKDKTHKSTRIKNGRTKLP